MSSPIESFRWIHGASNCAASSDPPIQSFAFDANTFILRQSKCLNFEAPFFYVLFGAQKALLLDTGSQSESGTSLPVADTVRALMQSWQDEHGHPNLQLVVAHTHSHGDHSAGDAQFAGGANTQVVPTSLNGVKNFFNLPQWPSGQATLDLGGRALTILPLPGHEQTHIAVYDENTGILLTGDTLYPGMLTVRDWPAYRRSADRLAQFATTHPVSHVLGAHIEMKNTARQMYPLGTTFQPEEHRLPLTAQHIAAWHTACEAMGTHPHHDVHDDFIIEPL